MTIRKATLKDSKEIHSLLISYAEKEKLLPRSLSEIYDNIRDFWIKVEKEKVIGCAALHIVWEDLGEIRSLAVKKSHHQKGIGKKLVERCIREGKNIGVKKIFALTYVPDFFKRIGFTEIPKEKLPHKIWSDCIKCFKFPDCDEIALMKNI